MAPVCPLGRRGRHPPGGQPGEPDVARHPGRHRAHLKDREDGECAGNGPAGPDRQGAEAEGGQHGHGAKEGERVPEVLVADQLDGDERRQDGGEQEPLAANAGDEEPDRGEYRRAQPDLVAEPPRVERQAGQRQRLGVPGLRCLREGAGIELAGEAEQPGAEPRQAEHDGHDQRRRRAGHGPLAAARQEQRRRGQ